MNIANSMDRTVFSLRIIKTNFSERFLYVSLGNDLYKLPNLSTSTISKFNNSELGCTHTYQSSKLFVYPSKFLPREGNILDFCNNMIG